MGAAFNLKALPAVTCFFQEGHTPKPSQTVLPAMVLSLWGTAHSNHNTFVLYLHQHSISLHDSILTGVRWNLAVVLICILLMAKDAVDFLLDSFAHLLIK